MRQNPRSAAPSGAPESTAEITGTLSRFSFRNPETGFAVVRVEQDGAGGAFFAVGLLAQLTEGQRVKLTGRWTEHQRFGRQFEVEVAEAVTPSTVEGIQAYLSSNLVPGIGPAMAERITDVFGARTLEIIDREPERLREVKGLGARRCEQIVAAVRAQRDVQEVMVFLRQHGLGPGLAARIVKRYGRGASAMIEANPYRLVDEVIGVGFQTADKLASRLGIAADAPERVRAAILHALTLGARDGHCFLPRETLRRSVAELLRAEVGCIDAQIDELAVENRVVIEDEAVYPSTLHQAETRVAACIDRLLTTGEPLPLVAEEALTWFEKRAGTSLPEGQRGALHRALSCPFSVITGGPGVGKTTIIRVLTEVLAARDMTVLLAAPTGRAAKRLEESTGHGAQTVHRLLEYQPGVHRFLRDEGDPLSGDLLVVDEASMLDVQLAYNLLRAVPPTLRVVMVGDINQLPAVGPGNVLADIIASGRVPVTELTEIYRQHGDSAIVRTAHGVLAGEVPQSGAKDSDFFFVEARSAAHARELVRAMVVERIPQAFGMDPLRDVQVLCPMYRGDAGADAINRDLQRELNPRNPEIERGGRILRQGDKVMQTRNDYDLDVFNGDVGFICHVDAAGGRIAVRFGQRQVEYSGTDMDQLVPAHAITVHRAQGSEYPAVIVPVVTDHYMMLRRNLLYTAITRGKRLVVVVGSPKALALAVDNDQESTRHSRLAARLGAR